MNDPRKPIKSLTDGTADHLRSIAHDKMLDMTSVGAKAVGCTGASFVFLGLGIWAEELAELDPKAAVQFFSAVAVLIDPNANHAKKLRAEKKRAAAVKSLFAAVDLDMANLAGSS